MVFETKKKRKQVISRDGDFILTQKRAYHTKSNLTLTRKRYEEGISRGKNTKNPEYKKNKR